MIDSIGPAVDLNWLLRQYLSNRCGSEWCVWLQAFTSHAPTMTWGCNGLLSSFNLARNPCLWNKEVTAVWGGSQCTGEITEMQRQASALSIPSLSFNIYQGVHSAPYPLQAAAITVHQKREGDASLREPDTWRRPTFMWYLGRRSSLLSLDVACSGGNIPSCTNRPSTGEEANVRSENL